MQKFEEKIRQKIYFAFMNKIPMFIEENGKKQNFTSNLFQKIVKIHFSAKYNLKLCSPSNGIIYPNI